MLIPRKVKHRKCHKGRGRNIRIASDKITLAFGPFGLKATTGAWLTSRQIESCRRVLTRYTRRGGKIWIRVFPDKPISKKGNEIRMGGGKGSVDHYVAVVRPGTVLFEMDGIPEDKAKQALVDASYKLSCKAVYITKQY